MSENIELQNFGKKLGKLSSEEILAIIDTDEFISFVETIQESLNDGTTYNEFLSSKEVLLQALKILKKIDNKKFTETKTSSK